MPSLVNQRYDLVTPERSVPTSPTLSAATVTHTTATSRHEHHGEQATAPAVDFSELTRRLQNAASRASCASSRPRSQLFQSSKPPSPSASSSTSSTSSSSFRFLPAASNSTSTPAPKVPQLPANNSNPRPPLVHRPASTSCATPSQFIFKKPEYNQHYHQTHFHHHQPPPPADGTAAHGPSTSAALSSRDLFLVWSDLRRFFVSAESSPPSSASSSIINVDAVTTEDNKAPPPSNSNKATFANQFRQDIEGRYGKWGKAILHKES